MKRKLSEIGPYMGTRSKKPVLEELTDVDWVSGTDVRNYMINDSLVDWLKLNRECIEIDPDMKFILDQGSKFEDSIIKYIGNNIHPVVTVSSRITEKSCKKTFEYMLQGVPLIHSAPFRNYENCTKGIIDLLVRSDYINSIFGNILDRKYEKVKADNLNGSYHYVVIDIKFSTLQLRSDGKHLLNTNSYPAYKGQVYIYTEGIGNLQGYTSRYGYILGRRYRYKKNGIVINSLNSLDKLGVIDYESIDKNYVENTNKAISWVRDVRKYGKYWDVMKPHRMELYPNMSVDSGVWNSEKKNIAHAIGDVTEIWYCGYKNRNNILEKGIKDWKDERCNSETLGIKGSKKDVIDDILNINRKNVVNIRPSKIKNNLYNWKQYQNEIFVDFETFSDIFAPFEDIPYQGRTNFIFMIGVYYCDHGGWRYKNFVIREISGEEERRICMDFLDFVNERGNPRLWYWYADRNIWEKVCDEKLNWVDMYKIFKSEPIVIKGCFKFGLKDIASAMNKNNMISYDLDSDCKCGLSASIRAWRCFKDGDKSILDDICRYNEYDVRIMYEILMYLRTNMI